jgi:hypothetical protein
MLIPIDPIQVSTCIFYARPHTSPFLACKSRLAFSSIFYARPHTAPSSHASHDLLFLAFSTRASIGGRRSHSSLDLHFPTRARISIPLKSVPPLASQTSSRTDVFSDASHSYPNLNIPIPNILSPKIYAMHVDCIVYRAQWSRF